MTLRTKLLAYLATLHALLAALAVVALRDESRWWLFAVELGLALSAGLGYRWLRGFFVPLDLLRTGAGQIAERDFSTRFRAVGQPEMDALIEVYNRMIDTLREERLQLQEQDRLLDRILDASASALLTCDFEGRVQRVNPAASEIFGLAQGELLGQRIGDLAHPLARALETLGDGESSVVSVDGDRRFRCRRATFLDRGFQRRVLQVDELTMEARAFERAAYEKLIRMVSHEVGNSVAAVGSLLESSLAYAPQLPRQEGDDLRQALEVAISRLESLNRFVDGFAQMVRIPPPTRRPVGLGELLQDLLVLLKPELEDRRIRCTLEIEEGLAPVSLDKNQMEQALVNAFKNAMEAVGEDGEIRVALSQTPRGTVLTLRDTGPGIPPEVAPQLFTPFFSTKKDGRGLGLIVLREVLSRHGFELSLHNAQDDAGGAELRVVMRSKNPSNP